MGNLSSIKILPWLSCFLWTTFTILFDLCGGLSYINQDRTFTHAQLRASLCFILFDKQIIFWRSEAKDLLGDDWVQIHRRIVQQHANQYKRISWSKVCYFHLGDLNIFPLRCLLDSTKKWILKPRGIRFTSFYFLKFDICLCGFCVTIALWTTKMRK